MNRFLLPTTLFFMLLFTFNKSGFAQIAVTSADFTSQLQLGKQVSTYLDRTSTQVNVGTQGATSWDFSTLVINDEFITESKQHSTSPYASDFPAAMYASNYEGIFEGNYSNTWVYNSVNNSFLTHGTGTVANTQAGNIKTVIKYEPAWEQYSFPIQYLDSKTYSGTQYVTTYVTIPGLGEFPNTIEQTVTIEQHVDAYGIVTMPDGKKLNALRLIETSTFNYMGTTSSSTVIRLLTKSGESVSITPANNQSLNGLIQIQNISWTSGDGESIIEETVNTPGNLAANAENENVSLSWTDAS
ncbi:MAG TPA: hypothetical protein PLS94_11440, partial [Prolixibacteraceae bacterium]|nr:hypothetical protein [Prolixibacteraceae bacterium]